MESIQQTLRSYKALALKNKSSIDALSHHVASETTLVPLPPSQGFQQIKQQYDLALTDSKASIGRNMQLQTELEFKQERLKALRGKLYKNFQEIEGLEFEMKRAAGQIKKEKKGWQETSRVASSNDKLKNELARLQKKRSLLEQEDDELKIKERLKKEAISKLEQEMLATERRYSEEERVESQRIEKLEHQISKQQQLLEQQRRLSNKSSTPQKANRSIYLQSMLTRIRQQRDRIQD